MKFKIFLGFICAGLLLLSLEKLVGIFPDLGSDKPLEVVQTYAYATAPSQKNGAVFGRIKGGGGQARIVSAYTDVAERIELHTHTHDGGIMMMREVEGYDVPKSEPLILEPTGNHIMLMGLSAPHKIGESFSLILVGEDGETFETNVEIIAPGSKPDE